MSLRARASSRLLLLSVLVGPSLSLHAQRPGSITGVVRGADRGPVLEGARVTLIGTKLEVITSRRGEFSFHGIAPGKYVIRASAIGYATLSSEIEVKERETLELQFEAQAESVRLPELRVAEAPNLPAEFVRRSETGRGRYMSRADIEKRDAGTVGDLLRTFPGVRVDCSRVPCRVQFSRSPRNCLPAFSIDGAPVDAGSAMLQPPRDLDGIEVYSGPAETPPELEQISTCGAIAIWTRTPPRYIKKDKKPQPAKSDAVAGI